MNDQGLHAAALLDASARAYAAGAVARLQPPPGATLPEGIGFTDLTADVEVRVRTLAESVAVGRPEVLRLDVDWLRSTYIARGVPVGPVEGGLRCLREELAESLPGHAGEVACAHLDEALASLASPPVELVSPLAADGPHAQLAREFFVAALEGRKRAAARMVLDAYDAGAGLQALHGGVIAAAQQEVGLAWQRGELHAAEEHLASRIVEDVLVLLHARAPEVEDAERSVLIASVPGNLHAIGARMISGSFQEAGWRTLFLGADTPAEDLAFGVQDFAPDLVALSVGLGLNLRTTARLIDALRAPGARRVPVLVGGMVFNHLPGLWKDVGADGFAPTGEEAVSEGTRLAQTA
jgi:methanogenic corrinoid protein MtbC1